MGSYIYAENKKTLKVKLPDGETLVAGVIEYVTKPYDDLWGSCAMSFHSPAERKEIAYYNRLLRKWAKMSAHTHVVQVFDDGTRILYRWLSTPQVYFFDDPTFGVYLIPVGQVGADGVLHPFVIKKCQDCQLSVFWDRYTMESARTGTHSLYIACTPQERLFAHWRGFRENQTREVARG